MAEETKHVKEHEDHVVQLKKQLSKLNDDSLNQSKSMNNLDKSKTLLSSNQLKKNIAREK